MNNRDYLFNNILNIHEIIPKHIEENSTIKFAEKKNGVAHFEIGSGKYKLEIK